MGWAVSNAPPRNRARANFVPERAEYDSHQRSAMDNPNGLRPGYVEFDPLRETTSQEVGRGRAGTQRA